MKQRLLFLFFCFLADGAYAQPGQPAFGAIDRADLQMTDCSFDNGAEAMKLIDWMRLSYDGSDADITRFKTVYERRTRVKILKESGLGQADVHIPYVAYNDFERISRVEAVVFNLDGGNRVQSTPVQPTSLYSRKLNNQLSELVIAFPQVKPGSVIEYRYRLERAAYAEIKDWYFQGDIPVRYSGYQVNIPSYLHFREIASVADHLTTSEEVTNDGFPINRSQGSVRVLRKTYSMRELPAIHPEPFMGAMKDYMQRIEFQLSELDYGNGLKENLRTSWQDVSDELYEDEEFGRQLTRSLPAANAVINQARLITDSLGRMNWIYHYVHQQISWNSQEDIFSYQGTAATWEKRSGNTADINLLLLNLLNEAGIPASPVLFSTRANGLVKTFFPNTSQFNTVLGYVHINGKGYILDAADKFSLYNQVPIRVVNTMGLVIRPEEYKWISAVAEGSEYRLSTAIRGEIDEEGKMTGEAEISAAGYARQDIGGQWQRDPAGFKEIFFQSPGMNITVQDIASGNIHTDSLPLELKVKFLASLTSSGGYRHFRVNLFGGPGKNPFSAPQRFSDIDFGYPQEFTFFGNYTIPPGYIYEEQPHNLSLEMPDKSILFTRFISVEENLLSVRIRLHFRKASYPVGSYPELREFCARMYEELNKEIVIAKH